MRILTTRELLSLKKRSFVFKEAALAVIDGENEINANDVDKLKSSP